MKESIFDINSYNLLSYLGHSSVNTNNKYFKMTEFKENKTQFSNRSNAPH